MKIRELQHHERGDWLQLRQLLWPDIPQVTLQEEQTEILSEPKSNCVLVAALPTGELVGFLEVSIRDWAEGCSTSPVGYVEGWYVKPEHRRMHVGRDLMRAAERWLLARHCTEVGSDAELHNELSHAAHQALGYSEVFRLVLFAKKIAQD